MCVDPAYVEAFLRVALLMALPFVLGLSAYLTEVVTRRFFPDLEERVRRFFLEVMKEED